MKENYQPWVIDYKNFDIQKTVQDQLRFFIKFAVLAPSGHNSQPWKFNVNDNSIAILIDQARSLSKSDPFQRQLYLSLGCALKNILIAADYYGFEIAVDYQESNDQVAKITFKKKQNQIISENHLVFSIPNRRTNRNKYLQEIPNENFISWLKTNSNDELQIDFIAEKSMLLQIADLSVGALIETMDNPNFRDELSQYLKSNFTNSKIGMPGFSHGIPAAISLIASPLIRRINLNRVSIKKDAELLNKFTPSFVVVSSKNDHKNDWLKVGQIYQHIALEAEKNNLKTALLAAPIQNENYNSKLQQLLKLKHRPQLLFRLGYCESNMRPTPRLSSSEVIFN